VVFTTNDKVYGKIYGNGKVYMCTNCDAYVGCHKNGEPLGILANKELRRLKKQAHALFDPIWKSRTEKRGLLYKKLAKQLDIETKDCHFGHFEKNMLLKSISIIKTWEYYNRNMASNNK